MHLTHGTWMGASAIALVAAAAAAGLYIWSQSNTGSEIAEFATLDPSCDIQQGSCQAVFPGGGRVTLSIVPRPIQAMKPLEIEVVTDGLDALAVEVDFRGLGMNMGYNRPRLEKQAEGRYAGTGMLAICVMDRMAWEATVLATTDDGIMAAPFRFDTFRP